MFIANSHSFLRHFGLPEHPDCVLIGGLMREEFEGSANWICARCDVALAPAKTKLTYLNKDFEAELMRCPVCHRVFIGESLALGKMLEVELSLEDK